MSSHHIPHPAMRITVSTLALLAICCFSTPRAEARVTNAIWRASLNGELALATQSYSEHVEPRLEVAKFKTEDFLGILLDTAADTQNRLALNIDMANNVTNFYLSAYSSADRENFAIISPPILLNTQVTLVSNAVLKITTNVSPALISITNNTTVTQVAILATNFTTNAVFDVSANTNTTAFTNVKTLVIADTKQLVFSISAGLVPRQTGGQGNFGGGFVQIVGRGRMVNGTPAGLHGTVSGWLLDNRPHDLHGTTGIVTRAKISTIKAPLRIQTDN